MDVTRSIPAAPDVVWGLLSATRHWPTWGPSVRAVDPPDMVVEPGLTGTVATALGPRLPFRVTVVEPGRSWDWEVAGVPATGHRVEPTPTGCRATIRVPWWAPAYAPVCAVALRRIGQLATELGTTGR